VDAADETYGAGNYTLIVTADHGGHGRSHGSDALEDTTIPWIVYGEGVASDGRPEGVRTMDTAATALWLLGVNVPAAFDGAPVLEAFTAALENAPAVSDP
jgi:arylsulfatase A-like enzyme